MPLDPAFHGSENTLEPLPPAKNKPILLVGLGNTGLRRIAEYTHNRHPRRGSGEGSATDLFLFSNSSPSSGLPQLLRLLFPA